MHQSIPTAPREFSFFFLMNGKFPGAGALKLSNARRWERKEWAKAPLYIMNHMRPVAKRDNSCTLKAPDLAIPYLLE